MSDQPAAQPGAWLMVLVVLAVAAGVAFAYWLYGALS